MALLSKCHFLVSIISHICINNNLLPRSQLRATIPRLFSSEIPQIKKDSEFCHPLIIGHRGACGYVPEHTLGSYALAILMGADYIEPDLVISKDHKIIASHDNELGLTTNVADHLEFASRYKKKIVDGIELNGWFCEDFTLAELKSLRVVERIPDIRPGNARLNGIFQIPTLQEIIDLAKSLQTSQRRVVGLYPEIKHATYYRQLGLPMEKVVIELFQRNGYEGVEAPACIQSFEVNCLKLLKNMTDIRLMQLFDLPQFQPFDQLHKGSKLTFGHMATAEGLREVAKYAYVVGVHKNYIIPCDQNNRLGKLTNFVKEAHKVGLKVCAYTFCAENHFLPAEYISGDGLPSTFGNFASYLQLFFESGIDGIFCDHPDVPVKLRIHCSKCPQLLH